MNLLIVSFVFIVLFVGPSLAFAQGRQNVPFAQRPSRELPEIRPFEKDPADLYGLAVRWWAAACGGPDRRCEGGHQELSAAGDRFAQYMIEHIEEARSGEYLVDGSYYEMVGATKSDTALTYLVDRASRPRDLNERRFAIKALRKTDDARAIDTLLEGLASETDELAMIMRINSITTLIAQTGTAPNDAIQALQALESDAASSMKIRWRTFVNLNELEQDGLIATREPPADLAQRMDGLREIRDRHLQQEQQ